MAELSLQGRGLRESGARALAMNPRLALLTALDLRKNGITSVALQALAASPLLARMVVLDLRENPSPTESLGALAQSPYLGQLRELLVGPKGIRFDEVERWFRWCGEKVAVHSGEDYPGR